MADFTTPCNGILGLARSNESSHPSSTAVEPRYVSSPPPIDDRLSKFPYLAKLHHRKPMFTGGPWVFWSQIDEVSQTSSSSDDPQLPDPGLLHKDIRYVFSWFGLPHFHGLIQFWVPTRGAGGRRLLTTTDQPFVLDYNLDSSLEKHRLCCEKYEYDIGVDDIEVEDDPLIISGAPARAFLSHIPEFVPNMSVDQGYHPLLRSALDCGFTASLVLPLFSDSSQSCCIGIVECYMKATDDPHQTLIYLNSSLEITDLCSYDSRRHVLNKNISGLQHAKDEIDNALQIIWETHRLEHAQVWIAYEDENHKASSSVLNNTQTKRTLGLLLSNYTVDEDGCMHFDENIHHYIAICEILPLEMGERLVGKTLEDHQARFCKDLLELDIEETGTSLLEDAKYSCFTICSTNIATRDLRYAFEFLWPQNRNNDIFMESLFITLKRCLPSFKFASDAKLGDELLILNVSHGENESFRILEGNKLSPIHDALEEEPRLVVEVEECLPSLNARSKTAPILLTQEEIEQQFGKTEIEAAEKLGVSRSTLKCKCRKLGIYEWQGPNFVKRKANDSHGNQNDTNDEGNGAIQDPLAINEKERALIIKAEYGDDMIKFHLPISLATFVAVEKEIGMKFKLNTGAYKLKYLDEDGDWILLMSDQDLNYCVKGSRKLNPIVIRLRVLPSS